MELTFWYLTKRVGTKRKDWIYEVAWEGAVRPNGRCRTYRGVIGLCSNKRLGGREPAFAVIDTEGNETSYVNKSDAQNAMKDGYIFMLLMDYSERAIAPNNKAPRCSPSSLDGCSM